MADHLTDEEQLQQLKNWWKENGASLAIAILVGLTVYFGFQWWQNHQQQQGEQASALYSELLVAIETTNNEPLSEEKISTANYLIDQIKELYSNSQYAINAGLLEAKLDVNSGDLEAAVEALKWVIAQEDNASTSLAALRLARLQYAQKNYDAALDTINSLDNEAYTSLQSELKGDILLAKNDLSGARVAYQEAIDTLGDTGSFRQRLLSIKLSNLPTGDTQ